MIKIISRHLEDFGKGRFLRNAAVLQIGNLVGTLIQGIGSIFMARLLRPELFGNFTLAFGISGVILVLTSIVSHDSIASALSREYTKDSKGSFVEVEAFILKILLITGVVTVGSIFVVPFITAKIYSSFEIGVYAALFAIALFFSNSVFALAKVVLQLVDNIRGMAWLGVADQFVRNLLAIIFVLLGFKIVGAISGHLVGAILITIISILITHKVQLQHDTFPRIQEALAHIFKVRLRKYIKFHFLVAVDRNISILYSVLPIPLVGIFVSSEEVGFFRLAFSYLNIILSLLGPISQLLNVEFIKMETLSRDNLRRNFIKVSLLSMVVSTILTVGGLIIAPKFFEILYGQSFVPAVPLVAGFFLYGVIFGLGIALGPIWRAINKVNVSILINTVVLGVGIPIGWMLIKSFGLWGAVATVTLWFTASHLISFIYLIKKIRAVD